MAHVLGFADGRTVSISIHMQANGLAIVDVRRYLTPEQACAAAKVLQRYELTLRSQTPDATPATPEEATGCRIGTRFLAE